MPLKNGRLTNNEHLIAREYAATGDVNETARRTGVHVRNVYRAIANPAILAETLRIEMARLTGESLILAVNRVNKILRDDKAPAGAQVSAAKLIFDRVFGERAGDLAKEPHEMSADELGRAIQELQRRASEKAKTVVIDNEPQSKKGVFD